MLSELTGEFLPAFSENQHKYVYGTGPMTSLLRSSTYHYPTNFSRHARGFTIDTAQSCCTNNFKMWWHSDRRTNRCNWSWCPKRALGPENVLTALKLLYPEDWR